MNHIQYMCVFYVCTVCGGVEVGINFLDCFVYYAFGKKKSMNILNQKRYLFYITQFAAPHCAVPQAFSCHPPLRKREREEECAVGPSCTGHQGLI